MNESEVRKIAKETATIAVKETLTGLGIDTTDPIHTQECMASLRELSSIVDDPQYRKDQAHLRKWRLTMEASSKIGIRTVVTVLFTGLMTAIGIGVMQMLKGSD